MTPYPLTWLYAPGDRPHVVAKALTSGADIVIVDLEDAVAPDRKDYARSATADLLAEPEHPVPVHVRVNALDTPAAAKDLQALATRPGLSGIRLPKVRSADQIVHLAETTPPSAGAPRRCTPCWSRPWASSARTRSPPPIRPCAGSPSASRICGPTWASGATRASTGPAPGSSSRPGPRAWPHRPSRSTPTSATWTAWRQPARTAVPSASSAVRPSTRASSR